jgi:hypothetical protein
MRDRIYHLNRRAEDEEVAEIRRELARATKLLCKPMPDTFLGRKTQEPFPAEEHPMDRPRN